MKRWIVTGQLTVDFEVEVHADDAAEAKEVVHGMTSEELMEDNERTNEDQRVLKITAAEKLL